MYTLSLAIQYINDYLYLEVLIVEWIDAFIFIKQRISIETINDLIIWFSPNNDYFNCHC